MIARKYFLNDNKVSKVSPKGQAAVVLRELKRDRTPRLADDIAKAIPFLKTTQTKERVVLYYILVFKKAGFVTAVEQEENDEIVETEDITGFGEAIRQLEAGENVESE